MADIGAYPHGVLPPRVGNQFTNTWPAWRQAIAAGEWAEVPAANTIGDINPENDPALNPNYPGTSPWKGVGGQSSIILPWCGGIYDYDNDIFRIGIGGGHQDYGGNEQYDIDLSQDVPEWSMVIRPSGSLPDSFACNDGQEASGVYQDGRPRATHSYNTCVYVPGTGFMLSTHGGTYYSGQAGKQWPVYMKNGSPETFGPEPSGLAISRAGTCYDPSRNRLWLKGDATGRMAYYDLGTQTWGQVNPSTSGVYNYIGMVYIPGDDVIVMFSSSNDMINVYDIGAQQFKIPVDISGTPVGTNMGGQSQPRYVESERRIYWWNNDTDTNVINYADVPADPVNGTYTLGTVVGGGATPTVRTGTGTYGRFFYSPSLDGFGLLNSVSQPIYFYARS